jgi:FkbM family methyltransferase
LRAPFYSVKRFIARAICNPVIGRLISNIFRDLIPSHGSVIHTHNQAILPTVKAALFWGLYESAEVRFVREYLRKDLDVVELGSSLGVVTSQILQKLEPGRRVVCVEASPHLLETLRKNIAENGKGREASVVHGAIAEMPKSGKSVSLSIGEDNTVSRVSDSGGSNDGVLVPAFTLSDILQQEYIEGDFALVSDIEGAEAGFIESDGDALGRCLQLIIELHETHWHGEVVTVDRLRSVLERLHGFRLRANHGPVCVFEKPSEAPSVAFTA